MRSKRRSFKAYLVEPFKQIRFGLHVVTVCLVFVTLLGWLYGRAFYEQYEQVFDLFQVAEKEALIRNDIFIRNSIFVGLALLGLILTMMFVVIRRTHKMYGPMVSILRFVSELSRGNYAVRIHVREKDDFKSLVSNLNALAQTLHSKHGSMDSKAQGLDGLDERLQSFEDGVVTVASPTDSTYLDDANDKKTLNKAS